MVEAELGAELVGDPETAPALLPDGFEELLPAAVVVVSVVGAPLGADSVPAAEEAEGLAGADAGVVAAAELPSPLYGTGTGMTVVPEEL